MSTKRRTCEREFRSTGSIVSMDEILLEYNGWQTRYTPNRRNAPLPLLMKSGKLHPHGRYLIGRRFNHALSSLWL